MRKAILIVAALIIFLAVSGCVSVNHDVKVNRHGEIVKYDTKSNMSQAMYGMLENTIMNDEGRSVEESFKATGRDVTITNNGDMVQIVLSGVPDPDNIIVAEENGYYIFRDPVSSFDGDSQININYYLEMPGEIVESNAYLINGNKAEWHSNKVSVNEIYAKSKIPPTFPIPNIGVFSTIIMVLIAFKWRKNDR